MKIAVIANQNYHMIGGVETYCRNLYTALPEHDFTEFPTINVYANANNGGVVFHSKIKNVKIDNSLWNSAAKNIQLAGTYPKRILEKIYQEFDLVILSVTKPPRKYLKRSKTILIQHEDQTYYSLRGKSDFAWFYPFAYFWGSLLFGIGTIRNPFKFAANSVFFAKETMSKKYKHYGCIPLPALKRDEIKLHTQKQNDILFVARYTRAKGFDRLLKIKDNIKNLKIYGSSEGKKYSEYNNAIDHAKLLEKMRKSKALLMTSRTEGFPFVIVEALSSGCLVVVIKDFSSTKYFDKAESVFLVNNEVEAQKKLEEISKLSAAELLRLQKVSINFAKKNLSKETFQKNWRNYLESVLLNQNK